MSATDDPFTQVHDALLALAKADTTLIGLVPNIVELEGDRTDAAQTDASVEELPRLMLKPDEDFLKEVRDSHEATIRATWNWELETGDKWPRAMLYPVIWRLFRVMAPARTLLKSGGASELTWNSRAFVYDVSLTTVKPDWDVRNRNRNSHGWNAILACTVTMNFLRTNLPP